ncbi:PepSY-associated TM helix domain-containing protein [uncultured Hymenobacter sp.]|uniref:PepSY-associated TM helix domain-containing protein n=1 Tax=uncultured Hymenobacter sp. TaxID=170016 RepID=UPI0035CA6A32
MSPTKTVFLQVHRWLGLASGLLIVFACLTGSVLAFEKEIEQALYPARYFVTSAAAAPLPPERLLAAVQAARPEARITGLKVYADPARTVEISLAAPAPANSLPPPAGPKPGKEGKGGPGGKGDGGGLRLYLNPYTAAITGELNPRDTFFHTVEQLHRGLVAGPTGKLVMGVSAAVFLFILSTGLVLWWPATRRALSARLQIKRGGSAKKLTYDWHTVLGFYSALFLLIMALTGVGMSFDWVGAGINKLTSSPPKRPEPPLSAAPAPGAAALPLAAALAAARRQAPAAEYYNLQLPKEPTGSIRVATLRPGRSLENATDEVYLDQYSGRVLSQQTYEQRPLGQRIRGLFKPVHTGAVGGWPTKLLALAVGLLGATFPITGTLLWLNRRRRNRNRPRQLQAVG